MRLFQTSPGKKDPHGTFPFKLFGTAGLRGSAGRCTSRRAAGSRRIPALPWIPRRSGGSRGGFGRRGPLFPRGLPADPGPAPALPGRGAAAAAPSGAGGARRARIACERAAPARPVPRPPARHLDHEGRGARASSHPRRPPARSCRSLPHLRPAPRPGAAPRSEKLCTPGSWRGPWGKSLHPERSPRAGEASAWAVRGNRGTVGSARLAPLCPRGVGGPSARVGGAGTAAAQDAPRFFRPGAGEGPQLPGGSPGPGRCRPTLGWVMPKPCFSVPRAESGAAEVSVAAPWPHPFETFRGGKQVN